MPYSQLTLTDDVIISISMSQLSHHHQANRGSVSSAAAAMARRKYGVAAMAAYHDGVRLSIKRRRHGANDVTCMKAARNMQA